MDKLLAAHRNHLRTITNLRYPKYISNEALYKLCETESLTYDIVTARWNLFGNILRGPPNTPAMEAMYLYFYINTPFMQCRYLQHRGRCSNLPNLLDNDLRSINKHLDNYFDLKEIRKFARLKDNWKDLVNIIARKAVDLEKIRYETRRAKRKITAEGKIVNKISHSYHVDKSIIEKETVVSTILDDHAVKRSRTKTESNSRKRKLNTIDDEEESTEGLRRSARLQEKHDQTRLR